MSQLKPLISDLRDRKLWPLAVLLVAALVAVPVLLSSSKPASPAQPLPSLATRISASAAVPSVNLDGAPVQAPVTGKAHDPFVQQSLPAPKASKPASASTASVSGGASAGSGSSTSGSGSSSSTGTGSSTGTASTGGSSVPPVLPVHPHPSKPAPSGLTSTEVYHVSIAITTASGGVNPIDPLVRDTELPNSAHPLLVELGVLEGGKRVLFSVQPGAVISGPGVCTPGPVDCEILSLAPNQTESVTLSGSGHATTLFQITDISVDRFASAAQASKARATVDKAGRRLLAGSTSSTLALFQYDPALDAVVDMRNLTVGGN